MSRFKDLSGIKFGRLTCIEVAGRDDKSRCVLWKCQCECGNQTLVRSNSLLMGNTKSCGCLQRSIASDESTKRTKHGLTRRGKRTSGVYKSWAHMKQRCLNKENSSYLDYGGRGITICDAWMNFENFYKWAMKNGYKEGLTIERIDVNGNHEPSNCKWIPKSEQPSNRRSNHYITLNSEQKTLSEWARVHNINPRTVFSRLYSGWPIERLFEPSRVKRA